MISSIVEFLAGTRSPSPQSPSHINSRTPWPIKMKITAGFALTTLLQIQRHQSISSFMPLTKSYHSTPKSLSMSDSIVQPDVSTFMTSPRPEETKDYIMQQTMLRVKDPVKSLDFYCNVLGFKLIHYSEVGLVNCWSWTFCSLHYYFLAKVHTSYSNNMHHLFHSCSSLNGSLTCTSWLQLIPPNQREKRDGIIVWPPQDVSTADVQCKNAWRT